MTYKAEFEDEEMEVFAAENHNEAKEMAFEYEHERGNLFNLVLLDNNYDEVETIW